VTSQQVTSMPLHNAKTDAPRVWRDALGPGYAVAAAESLLKVAGEAAGRPYRSRR